ncbi:hypothetical protein ACPA54_21385 [Uniformispora flossi]|uniref:hypothetical protein n=1 Tax=Uniformispora flossi TaxID=3390723 RepID=UPI003C2EF971
MATDEQLAKLQAAEEYAARIRQRIEHPIVHLPGGGTGIVESRSEDGTSLVRALRDGSRVILPWWLVRPVDDN